MIAIKFYKWKIINKIFEVWTLSGIGQYLTICTGQLVEFLGSDFQSSGPCHIVLLINRGPNINLKVTNDDRNEPRGFYRNSKLTYFGSFWLIWSFFEPDFRINIFKNNRFRITSIRTFDWCMNCHIWMEINFFHFFEQKGGPLLKKTKKIFFFKNDNSYTNRKPL
jgi:hypothetical protein